MEGYTCTVTDASTETGCISLVKASPALHHKHRAAFELCGLREASIMSSSVTKTLATFIPSKSPGVTAAKAAFFRQTCWFPSLSALVWTPAAREVCGREPGLHEPVSSLCPKKASEWRQGCSDTGRRALRSRLGRVSGAELLLIAP